MVGVGWNLVNVVAIFCVCAGLAKSDDETGDEAGPFQDYPSDITMHLSKNKNFVIYRNAIKHECYIEPSNKINDSRLQSRTLFVGSRKLSSSDSLYVEVGEDVITLCKNFPIFTTEEQSPYSSRKKRQTNQIARSNFKGQTQTQYISFDNEGKDDKGGVAEAIAEREKSRATVQGRIGMGQAQSQSGSGDPCEECIGSGRLQPAGQPSSASTGIATIPSGIGPQYGEGVPSSSSGNVLYPSQNVPQTIPGQGQTGTSGYIPQGSGTLTPTGTGSRGTYEPSVIGSNLPGGQVYPQGGGTSQQSGGTGAGYTPQIGGTGYPQQGASSPQAGGATYPQQGGSNGQAGSALRPQGGIYIPPRGYGSETVGTGAPLSGGTGYPQQGSYNGQGGNVIQPEQGVFTPLGQGYTPQVGGAGQPQQGQYPQGGSGTYPQQGGGQGAYTPQISGAGQPQRGQYAPQGGSSTYPAQGGGQGAYTPQISGAGQPQQGQYAPQGGSSTYPQPGGGQGAYTPQISGAGQPQQGQYAPQGGSSTYPQQGSGQGAYTPQIGGAGRPQQGQYTPQEGSGTYPQQGGVQGVYTPQTGGAGQPQQGQYAPQGGSSTYPQQGSGQGAYTPQISGAGQPQQGQYAPQEGSGTYPQQGGVQGTYTPQSGGAGQPQQGQYAPQGGSSTYPQQGSGQGAYTPQIGGAGQPQQGQYGPQGGNGIYPAQGGGQGAYTPQTGAAGQPQQGQYGPQGGSGTYPQQGGIQGAYTPQVSGATQPQQGQYGPQGGSGVFPQQGGVIPPQHGFIPPGGSTTYPQQGSSGGVGGGPESAGGPQSGGAIRPEQGSGVGAFYPQQGGYSPQGGTGQGGYTPQGVSTSYPQQNVQTQQGAGATYPTGSFPQGTTDFPTGSNVPTGGVQSGTGTQQVSGGGYYPTQTPYQTTPDVATRPGQIPFYSGQTVQGGGTSQGSQNIPIGGTYPQGGVGGGIQPQQGLPIGAQQGGSGGINGGSTYFPQGQGPYYSPSGSPTTGGYPTQGFYTPQGSRPTLQTPQGVGAGAIYPQGQGGGSQSGVPQAPVVGYYPSQTSYQTGTPGVNQFSQTPFYNSGGQTVQGGDRGVDTSQGSQIIPVDPASGESQSLSSLNIHGNDTKAQASAQGKTRNGMAQAQVSGTYSGSFSAQAQTSDNEKSVETQIFGNSTGAVSSSQGKAGKSQSQSQIRYDYNTGASIAESQGGGINYNTNSQIQAGNKGGVADAQSSGPGSSASQAQIGFVPYDVKRKDQTFLFEGGGTSSSQSSSFSGQSQTQFQGAYRFGPSFVGAAQSSSGRSLNVTKLAFNTSSLSNPATNEELKLDPTNDDESVVKSEKLISEKKPSFKKENNVVKSTVPLSSLPQNDEDKKFNSPKIQSFRSKTPTEHSSQDQNAFLKSKSYDALIYRDSSDSKPTSFLNAGDVIPGTNDYKIPLGFRGRITSTAGDITQAVASSPGQAQTQTVILKPGEGRVTINDRKQQKYYNIQNDNDNTNANVILDKKSTFNDYVTVTKSETGELNGGDKKYAHTYFTKSSSCGYFTFTCNLIDGSKGRTKICKPGPLTYSDGTPC